MNFLNRIIRKTSNITRSNSPLIILIALIIKASAVIALDGTNSCSSFIPLPLYTTEYVIPEKSDRVPQTPEWKDHNCNEFQINNPLVYHSSGSIFSIFFQYPIYSTDLSLINNILYSFYFPHITVLLI